MFSISAIAAAASSGPAKPSLPRVRIPPTSKKFLANVARAVWVAIGPVPGAPGLKVWGKELPALLDQLRECRVLVCGPAGQGEPGIDAFAAVICEEAGKPVTIRLLDPQPGEQLADMFCGIGNFALACFLVGQAVSVLKWWKCWMCSIFIFGGAR